MGEDDIIRGLMSAFSIKEAIARQNVSDWLREIKPKKYSTFRFDTFFSKTKYTNIKVIQNGGWHFS